VTDGFERRKQSRWGEGAALRDEILDAAAGAGADRMARLLWSSVYGMVATSVTVPFAADPQRLEERAEDPLGLAPAR